MKAHDIKYFLSGLCTVLSTKFNMTLHNLQNTSDLMCSRTEFTCQKNANIEVCPIYVFEKLIERVQYVEYEK
jgi:hypothetical protein